MYLYGFRWLLNAHFLCHLFLNVGFVQNVAYIYLHFHLVLAQNNLVEVYFWNCTINLMYLTLYCINFDHLHLMNGVVMHKGQKIIESVPVNCDGISVSRMRTDMFASRGHNPAIFAFIPFRRIWLITYFSTHVTRQIPLAEQERTAYLSIPSTSVNPKISLELRCLIINFVDHCLCSPLFSSPGQRPCELLPSLCVRRPSVSVRPSYVVNFHI